MSTRITGPARAPVRRRGHARVAAILDAGSALFRERGFEAATMTEIAARSRTAIGSLYRFFPSKEALADALLVRFAEDALARLAAIEEQAAGRDVATLADALVRYRLGLAAERGDAIGLVEQGGDRGGKREQFRRLLREGIARTLRAALPTLQAEQSERAGAVVLALLKGIAPGDDEPRGPDDAPVAEFRHALVAYLTALGQ